MNISEISKEMKTQDNRATQDPLWLVLYEYTVTKDEDGEPIKARMALTACFTGKAAEAWIERHKHDYQDGRIFPYVISCHNNPEMQAVMHNILCMSAESGGEHCYTKWRDRKELSSEERKAVGLDV